MRFFRYSPAATREPRPAPRWRLWVVRSAAGLGGLLALVAVLAVVLLHSLNRAWLKLRLVRLVRTAASLDIDYDAARVDLFSGAHIDGLVVRSPAEFRAVAPDLVRVGRLDARWSLGSLVFGRGPAVSSIAVSGVTLTVVVDEHGRTSFDALAPSPPPPPTPSPPLSHMASTFLGAAPPVGHVDIDRVALNVIQTDHGEVESRTELRGVAIALATMPAQPPERGWRAQVGLGSPAQPVELELTRAPAGAGAQASSARAKLWLTVDATSSALSAALNLRMTEQTFAASLSANRWLHAEARLRFDPAAGRTDLAIDHTEAGDGAVTADVAMELPDRGDPVVRHAGADVDGARLLRWLPAGLVPVTAERARVRARVDSLVLGSVVRLSEGGGADVDADLSNVSVATPSGHLQVGSGTLSAHAQPAKGGGIAARGSLKLGGTRLASGGNRLVVDNLAFDFDGQQGPDADIGGRATVRFARIERTGATPVVAGDGSVDVHAEGLHVDSANPLATRGDVSLGATLGSLDVRTAGASGMRVLADGCTVHAHAALLGHPPYAVELEAPVTHLRIFGGDGKTLADAPARVEVRAHDVQPDDAHPIASRGVVHAGVDVGAIGLTLDATKDTDAVDFALHGSARSLGAVRPFLPANLTNAAPWDRMAVTVQSTGRVERLSAANPAIRHATDIHVEHPAFANAAAGSIAVTLKSQGTALQHHADVDLHAQGLALDGGNPRDDHVTLSATVDRTRPSLEFDLATEGRAATKLSASVSFDASRRAVVYDIDGHLARPRAARAAGGQGPRASTRFDLSQLEVGLSAHGALLGVVAGVSRDGAVQLEPNPAQTAGVEGTADAAGRAPPLVAGRQRRSSTPAVDVARRHARGRRAPHAREPRRRRARCTSIWAPATST